MKLSRAGALTNWSGIFLQLFLKRSRVRSFSRALSELSFQKILKPIRYNDREIFLRYSQPHSLWVICYFLGNCLICRCTWKRHIHITYEYQTSLTDLDENCSLSDIDQRITNLRDEKATIEDVYKQLSKFLHANSLLPINDDILAYLEYFIRLEQMEKHSRGQDNTVVEGLRQMMRDYEEEINLFKQTIKDEKDPSKAKGVLKCDEIFPLVGTLYRLPINGPKIREQVDKLKIGQNNLSTEREIFVELPATANSSKVMNEFKNLFSER